MIKYKYRWGSNKPKGKNDFFVLFWSSSIGSSKEYNLYTVIQLLIQSLQAQLL